MKRLRNLVERHPTGGALTMGSLGTAFMLVRMFLPSPIGLADQGDGHRLLCQLGLRNAVPWNASPAQYVYFSWLPHRYFGETCGANGTSQPYFSSALGLMRIAGWVTHALGFPGGLDLRALAVLCSVLVGVGVSWTIVEMRGAMLPRLFTGLLLVVVLADSGIAPYFASPYSETVAIFGLLLLCPATLRLLRGRHHWMASMLSVVVIGAVVLTAKTQMLSFLPGLLLLLLVKPASRHDDQGHQADREGWLRTGIARRAAVLIACAGLVALSASYLSSAPPRFAELDSYDQVFGTILPHSPNKAADLRFFGLDPSLATGSGSNILSPNSVAAKPAYLGFTAKVTPTRIAEFYLTHPTRLFGLAGQGLEGAATYRLSDYLATYPPNAGEPPGSVEHRVELLTGVFSVLRAAPGLLALLWLAALIGFGVATRRRSAAGVLGLALTIGILVQFWAVMLTEAAAELIKHMIIVDYATALLLPVGVMAWLGRRNREPPAAEEVRPELRADAHSYGRHSAAPRAEEGSDQACPPAGSA
ncbi:MAG: hypothetical protein ACRDRL_24095 [Sciscionella sp.]